MIEVSTEKRTENFCNNALRALMQFAVLFWLIPRSTEKILHSLLKSCFKKKNNSTLIWIDYLYATTTILQLCSMSVVLFEKSKELPTTLITRLGVRHWDHVKLQSHKYQRPVVRVSHWPIIQAPRLPVMPPWLLERIIR